MIYIIQLFYTHKMRVLKNIYILWNHNYYWLKNMYIGLLMRDWKIFWTNIMQRKWDWDRRGGHLTTSSAPPSRTRHPRWTPCRHIYNWTTNCIIIASSLHHHCIIIASSLHHHCIIIASSLHHHCIIIVSSLHHHYIIASSLHHHCIIIASSLHHYIIASSLHHYYWILTPRIILLNVASFIIIASSLHHHYIIASLLSNLNTTDYTTQCCSLLN